MSPATRFVLATFNPDKARELAAIFARAGIELVTLDAFPGAQSPEENGTTLEENARIKAEAAMRHSGLPAIADDTGLEVDALDGEPGVRAARFAGPQATYADNVRLLLERLSGVDQARRTARFRCVCAAALPEGRIVSAEGRLEGVITETARGNAGFGYDPVFEIPALGKTLAELGADEKNRLSHRARAAEALAAVLQKARSL